eukprot:206534-Chlamydomonas_euryale.AAC.1
MAGMSLALTVSSSQRVDSLRRVVGGKDFGLRVWCVHRLGEAVHWLGGREGGADEGAELKGSRVGVVERGRGGCHVVGMTWALQGKSGMSQGHSRQGRASSLDLAKAAAARTP